MRISRVALVAAILGTWPGLSHATGDFTEAATIAHSPPGQQALEFSRSGTAVQWVSPGSGMAATIVPQPAFQSPNGQICREFQQTVTIGNQAQEAYGTACRQQDGSWRIQAPRAAAYIPPPPDYQPPPRVVYVYPPVHAAPVYYYHPRPIYYSSRVIIGSGGHYRHHHHRHHRRW